jgi:chromosome segregation ATPase
MATSNRERLEAIRNEMESSIKFLEELKHRKEGLLKEIESVLERISQRRTGIFQQEEKLRKLVAEADLVQQDILQRKEEIDGENADLVVVEQELRGLRQQLSLMTASFPNSMCLRLT